ncbi:DUF6602 domain-containing protein [Flavobacterium sp. KACC 22763]|uniref:DUF6602 domain-containing protein n=1 Tax=Flavobacterium sp. KACC 22763 TaxID=3025668 RepID=UPI002366EB49|nr:DUF6602 domain-containing protein [Flavobacterium sp. KACC 22763]WDF66120.1 hypothetical protein PQ463_08125 [Flavobacterium sp. KACC 22763]
MINTISDFLEQLKKTGLEQISLNDSDIKHTVTIGNMYEGLTSEILNKSIFSGLNLKIVNNSFIYNDSGRLSKEMDCMIVIGDGKKISFSNQYKYHIRDVVAVVQVKKKLYKNDIYDAHENLRSVIEVSEPRDGEQYMNQILSDSYKLLVGKNLPSYEQLPDLSWREQMMYHYLQLQAFWPIRILIGYESYKKENALRESFYNLLKDAVTEGPKPNYSPVNFPDLLICGQNSIIKNIGMPFAYPLEHRKEFFWQILFTTNEKPMFLLLEMIWTRLSYRFSLGSEIFGDDFSPEGFHKFLSCKENQIDESYFGWEYNYTSFSDEQLAEAPKKMEWEPVKIDENETIILKTLVKNGRIKCDEELKKFLASKNVEVTELIKSLTAKRIAYQENDEILLLIDLPVIALGNGQNYIGENKSGEMFFWMNKQPAGNSKT